MRKPDRTNGSWPSNSIQEVGFAVIQGTDLLDWGVRTFPFGVAGAEVAIGNWPSY